MCFKDNVSFFKMFNVAFFVIHMTIIIACCIVYSMMDGAIPVYYQISVTGNQVVDVKLLYVSFIMHSIAMLFHFSFFLKSTDLIELMFPKNFTNPYHWLYQFFVDGIAFVGVMLIHGFQQIETVGIVLALYGAIIVLCFYQDQYMNRGGQFQPTISPHTFGIPLYIVMVLFIAFKSTEHISGPDRIKITIVTSISLFQSGLMFIIQKLHIGFNKVSDMEDLKEEIKNGDAEEVESGEELDIPISKNNEMLDMEIAEMNRAVKYDLLHYLNSVVFHIAISWIIINLTRAGEVLH